MKIQPDRITAGFTAEKTEKQSKLPQTAKPVSSPLVDTKDAYEMTSKKAAVLNAARETAEPYQIPDEEMLKAVRERLAIVNRYMLKNPDEALSAQANLNADTVADLVG
jgi:hypothetical protein